MTFILENAKLTILVFLISFSFISCDEDDLFDPGGEIGTVNPEPDPDDDNTSESNTIADFVAGNDEYSSLLAALEATDLTSTFTGEDVYTVFAPNNTAFDAFLSANNFASLEDVPEDILTQVLLNHVQTGAILSSDLSTGYIESMATAGPDGENLSLYVNINDGVTINGVSNVTTADVEVDNGVIHAVDAVIGLPDVTTFATADPTFETLVTALTREESYTFVSTLSSSEAPAPFTVFAPTNDAFASLLEELELNGLGDIPADLLAKVLSYHVVTEANVTSVELTDGMSVTSLESGTFTINLGDNVTITDENFRTVTLVATDVQATNGVIHAIDMVLLPEDDNFEAESSTNTIADFVAGNENYSSLLAALEATGLTSTFTGEDIYTVFAPNNTAFDAFLSANGFDSLEDVPEDILTQVLLNHVQTGAIMSTDLTTGYIASMSTAGPDGENLSIYISTEDGVLINGISNVTTADVELDNGIIHAVDSVIGLPDVTTFAVADPNFSSLVTALSREDLVGTLQSTDSPAPFTVFAPTNDAFSSLLNELEAGSLDDIDSATLSPVLQYHVIIENNVTSDELTNNMIVSTLQGENIIINLGDNVTITDANDRVSTIIAVDVQATNGVIHAIDRVLLPTL